MNIDTLAIDIELSGKQNQTDPRSFTPCTPNLWQPKVAQFWHGFVFRSEKIGKATGEYMPQVTFHRETAKLADVSILTLTFSVPKLLFNTDYRPVVKADIEVVASALIDKLNMLGFQNLNLEPEQIYSAKVKRFDAYIDTIMPDRSQMLLAINRLQGAALPKPYSINRKAYFNNGFGIEFHDAYRDIVFYDKETELTRSAKGAKTARLEEDNYCQLGLLKKLQQNKRAILRYEIKISRAQRIRTELQRFGIDATKKDFAWFYQSGISTAILAHYWKMIYASVPDFGAINANTLTLLEEVAKLCPVKTLAKVLSSFGGAVLSQHKNQNQVRAILEHYCPTKSVWENFKKVYELKIPTDKVDPLTYIAERLRKAQNHQNMMLANSAKALLDSSFYTFARDYANNLEPAYEEK